MPSVQSDQAQTVRDDACAPAPADFHAWLESVRRDVDSALAAHLTDCATALGPHSQLAAAVEYSFRVGGKRVRPILVLECSQVCGGAAERAMPSALALEFVHTFSLIHDDLPAMDDDDLRRGQPTNHRVFGEGPAILAGDWLLAHAFMLVGTALGDGELAAALTRTLADGTERMIAGQAADLAGMAQATDAGLVRYIHEHKTAALLETACRLGALCAGADEAAVRALAAYGRHVGLAFQIADDVLDATGAAARLGKAVRKDAAVSKQTYPAAFGTEESRARAQAEVEAATTALAQFGPRAIRLRELASFVVARDH